ncbi:MAG: hypothetical protein J6Z82_09600 [Schwartzia sp.]|nr:hypothetical protein [Schwartzia sp. (in: firmicutes)]
MKKALLLIMVTLVAISCITGCGGGSSGGKSSSATQSQAPKQKNYAEANINQLLQEAKDNAAKANRAYKGKDVKIVGGEIKNIDSDVKYISLDSSTAGLMEYGMLSVRCDINNEKLKDKVLDFKKEQAVIVYGTIKEVGDLMGYSMVLDNIEAAQ